MERSSFHEEFKKKQIPGNYEKKRLDRTYQIASSVFDAFPPQNSTIQKLFQSEASENEEIQMELTNLLIQSHCFDLGYKSQFPQQQESSTRRNSLNLSNSTSMVTKRSQKSKYSSRNNTYDFFKEYGSSFMTKTANTESKDFKYSFSKPI